MENGNSDAQKAEAIKKSWIAEIGEEKFSLVETYIFKDTGFASRSSLKFDLGVILSPERIDKGFSDYIRPVSLSGIENNNGWIRIEPDGSNLQKGLRSSDCESGLLSDTGFERTANPPLMNLLTLFRSGLITHYKPIEKSKPPIH